MWLVLQDALTRHQVMRLGPDIAAALGVPTQQVDAALAAALTAVPEQVGGKGQGLALDVYHECR